MAGLSTIKEENSPIRTLVGCRGRIRTATFPIAKSPLISQENFAFFREFRAQRLLHPADAEPGVCTLAENSWEAS